jgi:alkylated DNA repair protein (DNA oxidative demethylase)
MVNLLPADRKEGLMATPKKKDPPAPGGKTLPAQASSAPDVVFQKGFLSLAEQKRVYQLARTIEPGFYVPVLRNGNTMNLRMNCLGYHWSAVTYQYSTVRDIDGKEAAAVPAFFNQLALRALRESHYWPEEALRPYDICIVNWYDEVGSKLGLHRDNSETAASLASGYPVVSLSIGATAVFTIGGLARQDPQEAYLLESGEVVIFGRSKRLAYHGITKITKGTTPPELEFEQPGRLNLTFRVM